jgi:Zn-dependent peptidase ImmA (M78 family)
MSDAVVDRLCEHWKMKSPEGAITKALYSSFPELARAKAPVDMSALAVKRGIVNIKLIEMQADGMIFLRKQGGYEVKLNSAHSINRRRFTLGHEIGHTFFFELDDERVAYRTSTPSIVDKGLEGLQISDKEEMLCNMAAAEMLLPQDLFRSLASRFGLSALSLIELAKTLCGSLWSVSKRLVQFGGYNLAIAVWEYNSNFDSYRTQWLVKARGARTQSLEVTRTDPFFSTLQSNLPIQGRKWLSLGGPIVDYFVDTVVLRPANPRRVLTLFILEKRPELLLRQPITLEGTRQMSFL